MKADGTTSPASHSDSNAAKPSAMTVVGIGASAGGLKALRQFFQSVPDEPGIPFIVVVHLSPEHESHLADLLQPYCKMPVQQVTETTAIKPNHVYVIPPNANLNTVDTHLRLSELEAQRRARSPIDHFFRTLSETHDGNSVAVILTGTGADGALGLRRIKEAGGLTISQSPEEAEYDGMPRSAIETGMVDMVLPLADIPEAIISFANISPRVVVPDEDDQVPEDDAIVLQRIFSQLRGRTGHDFARYKRSTIMRRIRRRMMIRQIETLPAYLNFLREDPDEINALFNDMLITVTEFFRDPAVFDAMEQRFIPQLFKGKSSSDSVRAWSVGCSSGEEAYSLAIMLIEEAEKHDDPPEIQVFASDLHVHSLEKAREGLYPAEGVSHIPESRLNRYFIKNEDGTYRVRREVREKVVFAPHDLLKDPPFSHLDLAVCRNLLIYLQRDLQQEVLSILHYALNADAFLLLGTSEAVEAQSDLFIIEDKKNNIFRRRNVPVRETRISVFTGSPLTRVPVEDIDVPEPPRPRRSYRELHEDVFEMYAPPSVLLNQNHEVAHYTASAGQFFDMPGGEPSSDIFRLLIEPLQVELRTALYSARKTFDPVVTKPVTVATGGAERQVAMRVRQAADREMSGFFLVIFDEVSDRAAEGDESGDGQGQATASDLAGELDVNRQRLRTVIEEYETSQEEMKASNEELQSANEELRSTLEELETSKEELQSMNEELATANQENRHRVEELSQLSGDLQNLLIATDIATLFLDRSLRIVRFTPQVAEVFNVREIDRGRPVTDLTHRLGHESLVSDARRVLDKLVPVEREVEAENGRTYTLRILPYRTSDDRIDGVVVTLFDVTRLTEAEEALVKLTESLGRQVRERTETLENLNRRLRQLVSDLTTAEQRERQRIAQVIHDHLQQLLIGMNMKIKVAQSSNDQEMVARALSDTVELLNEAINESRELTVQLRPPALYESGFISALRWLTTWMSDTHGLDVTLDFNDDAEPTLDDGSPVIFESVRELLLNVVKHSGMSECEVVLRKAGEQMISITVMDGGDGFDAAFAREKPNATGMGLFSIHERISLMGGELKVNSKPGETRIEMVIPTSSAAGNAVAEHAAALSQANTGWDPGIATEGEEGVVRVLLADDHPIVREGMISTINLAPDLLVVGEAADGATAITLVRSLKPDVVVLDVNMPGTNGIAAARAIKAQLPEVQIVGLSIHADEGTAQAMLDAGACAYVVKDAPAEDLQNAIRNAVGRPVNGTDD